MAEINEVRIKGAIDPISMNQSKTILEQMQYSVCKLHVKEKKGTGFFIQIPNEEESVNVLVTNNHVLNEKDIALGETISFSLNNMKVLISFTIKKDTKRYTNENLDITIIELKDSDDRIKFLSLDHPILGQINQGKKEINNGLNNFYSNESVYVLNYIEDIFVSYGLLVSIDEDTIEHRCNTEEGSSGSPIISLKTNKVIGVHYGGAKGDQFESNYGILLIKSLLEFKAMTNNFLFIRKNDSKYNNINFNESVEPENQVPNEYSLDCGIIPNKFISNISVDSSQSFQGRQTQAQTNVFNVTNFHVSLFKHLVRFHYLKKELNSNNNSFKNKMKDAYLLNAKVLNKLKQFYNINDIISNLDNKKLNGISYNNFEDNFYRITAYLVEIGQNPDYLIDQIQLEEEISFTNDEISLTRKGLKIKPNLKYLDNIEIIDKKFYIFLKSKFKNIEMPLIKFSSIKDNKILLIMNEKENEFYQIMDFDSEDNLTFKYLIEIVEDKINNNMNELNDYLLKILKINEIKNYIIMGNPIILENNKFSFNLYSNCLNSETKRKHNISRQKNYSELNLNTIANLNFSRIYLPKLNNNYDTQETISIIFEMKNGSQKEIKIDYNKKFKDLIHLFFKEINRTDLFEDNDISFYYNNKKIPHGSKDLIKELFSEEESFYLISVKDPKNKI